MNAAAALILGLLLAAAPALAQDTAIERQELEPLRPLTPGGTVIGPDGRPIEPPEAEAEGEGEGEPGETAATDPTGDGEQGPRDRFMRVPPGTGRGEPKGPELIEPVETVGRGGAVLRELDKMTGRTETVEVPVGGEARVARLRIAVEECRTPVESEAIGNIAFVRIWDMKDETAPPVFSGWMFADSPALSAMDHPRYDVWVIRCTTASGGTSTSIE